MQRGGRKLTIVKCKQNIGSDAVDEYSSTNLNKFGAKKYYGGFNERDHRAATAVSILINDKINVNFNWSNLKFSELNFTCRRSWQITAATECFVNMLIVEADW